MLTLQKGSGWAAGAMITAAAVSGWIYLTGNLQAAAGPALYAFADTLSGPVWAAGLVVTLLALRERAGERAPGRLTLAVGLALVAAGGFVAVAAIRAANRQYHLLHPELHLEQSAVVLAGWGTLVAGLLGAAWHLLGWAWLLVGWSTGSARSLPRWLSRLYGLSGLAALGVYLVPDLEGAAVVLGLAAVGWQGWVLALARSDPAPTPP